MTQTPLDYTAAGVDYSKIDPLKILAQKAAAATAGNLHARGVSEIPASRGESAYVMDVGGVLIASITECLGTKALVADAVRPISGKTHYDSIAQDTIAMAVNDLITVGATPLSIHAYWSAGGSEWFADETRMTDLVTGWQRACDVCHVSWGGGETPALAGVVEAGRIDLAASSVGIIPSRDRLTLGDKLGVGDAIVLLASSGIHANGVSLARKLVERLPEGYATKIADGRSYGEALLDPTTLYVPVTEALFAAGIVPHYSANVTGHGWRKIMRHAKELTYRFHTLPDVPPVLSFIQQHAAIDDREAYGSLNMGAGFAFFVAAEQADEVVRIAHEQGVAAWNAGVVESGPKQVVIEPLQLTFAADELHLRA
ncbi:MAG: phosphoribosylformylglycinamidine cyclo-ligase [Candidatus Dactylopiibacterium carminicum]|uniref:Phosphoribosylformylglycinamidine cyclo-ligase n=1 Tax=Candidatus Dactylopiibacterium carminicum TaxID=857335 RepID=A0A272ENP9_9RHOO|nr:AIR synthase-related protein [Candidatus Dactylopiibacterium carminicum]KAF7598101.1 phosphoribosylformylglycinamidine cyclo-ligase [Candidatus Dactylopiibacterium carminicum]PAS91729.1 MAG: phosphoribosylformylglycinamidine cyclo-ligase [Candidatus Dactylopiibacterium carminicum]PAS93869.1 MAG: phosphoribosylformylglycinamidine cyclo-ligase [Candidatus Dactylopiibacterium carminicum]PAS96618.1 MAG: phosphoribosylformylglycinamidine cyclo-ligase [Candidatus Dactylopiibacterium carminicum]